MKRALSMYVLVSLFLFFEMALQVSPSVMSSQLMNSLNIGSFGLGLMSGCYFYTYTAMQVPSGALFDRFNPRIIITSSITICAIGSLIFSFSNHIALALIARLLMGTGSAFAFVSVLVVTGDLFNSKHFATLTGITQMLAALGAMSGQMPISHIVEIIGWRYAMILFSIVGFLIAGAVFVFLRYQRQENKGSPLEGAQRKRLKNIFSNRQTWFVAAYACLLWTPMSGFASLWGVPFINSHGHFSPSESAFLCSLMWLGLATASPLVGALSSHINSRKKPLITTALIGLIAFTLVLLKPMNAFWTGALIFISGAACSGQALSFTVVKENNHQNQRATALALNNMAVVISGALAQPLIGWLLRVSDLDKLASFQLALSVILIAYAASFLIALFSIRESVTKKHVETLKNVGHTNHQSLDYKMTNANGASL